MRARILSLAMMLVLLGGRLETAAAPVRKSTVRIPMADGVELATDVYLPPGPGPFPAILSRTPYGKRNRNGDSQARHGYAIVIQDMRGRFDSAGRNLPFIGCGWSPTADGADTVAWIRRQPWSNGKVGSRGGSAGGITQNLMAATAPEGLLCQYINAAAASLYHHAVYVGGALRESQITRWLSNNAFDAEAVRLYRAHSEYDTFWHSFDSMRRIEAVDCPAVHVGGWFDTFSLGTIEAFAGRQNHGAPAARGTQKLVMGPWGHGGYQNDGRIGDLTFPNARMPPKYGAAAWFTHYLKGVDNGSPELPAVAYYVMGDTRDPKAPGNEWRYAGTWPPPHRLQRLYLHAAGHLHNDAPNADNSGPAACEFTFDPAAPCPTAGGCNLVLPAGPLAQNAVEARDDVVVFATAPLPAPLEVSGRAKAVLFLSSSAVDTDISVRLCDVYPDGTSYLMAEGMQRLRLREDPARPELLEPGTVYKINVECWPTSVVFNRGHRIRVAITSSNSPRFDINPGTGRPWTPGAEHRRQRNRIFCAPPRASYVLLPIPTGKGQDTAK